MLSVLCVLIPVSNGELFNSLLFYASLPQFRLFLRVFSDTFGHFWYTFLRIPRLQRSFRNQENYY